MLVSGSDQFNLGGLPLFLNQVRIAFSSTPAIAMSHLTPMLSVTRTSLSFGSTRCDCKTAAALVELKSIVLRSLSRRIE